MAQEPEKIGQTEIEELLRQAQAAARPAGAGSGEPEGAGNTAGTDAGGSASVGTAAAVASNPGPMPGASTVAMAAGPAHVVGGGRQSGGTGNGNSVRSASAAAQSAIDDVQLLLSQADQALRSIDHPSESHRPGVAPFQLREFSGSAPSSERATLDLLRDVELNLKIELGRTQMYLEDVLKLRRGSVVALDKLAGDPVDIYVNSRLIARGEILVLNDNFCVRVAELVAGDDV
jgi:flagellar motor switch protein FliN/FliY